jgi:hypothetical protein
MYGLVYSTFTNYIKNEGFTSGGDGNVFFAALAVVLVIFVQLFIVRWLWNTVLVRVTTIVKPLPSLLYALGLLVLIAMIHPGCAI